MSFPPQRTIPQYQPMNQFQMSNNNALVSLGNQNSMFMPTTVTHMNATPLASTFIFKI